MLGCITHGQLLTSVTLVHSHSCENLFARPNCTRDEQTKRAVSMGNMDEEEKQTLTGDEEDLERLTSW